LTTSAHHLFISKISEHHQNSLKALTCSGDCSELG
jgi:hypothetical protein